MRVLFLGANFIFCFLITSLTTVQVSSERLASNRLEEEASSGHQSGDVKVLAWTWNSMKRDLSAEAADVFGTDADVLVSCQTEAVKAMRDYTDDSRWLLVSHGEHKGFSGGHSDAQILSVFIRQPADGSEPRVAIRPAESEWTRAGIGLGIARLSPDVLMDTAVVPGLLAVETRVHQTSSAGKGGLSAHISWDARDGHAAYKTSFLCAHLDSQSEAERSRHLTHIFRDMNGLTAVSRSALGVMPCIFWDFHSPECQADVRASLDARHSSHEKALIDAWMTEMQNVASPWKTDAVVILGDLNYRLSYWDLTHLRPFELEETEALVRMVSTADGREQMAVADPLNPRGSHPASLVRPSLAGFGFVCNEPYRHMPWTYKRRDLESCVRFGSALRRCDEGDAAACEEALWEVRACYARENGHDGFFESLTGAGERPSEWEWQTKGSDLQLGWLDRVCVRSVGASGLRVAFTGEERGWTETGDSDHLAISSVFVLTPP